MTIVFLHDISTKDSALYSFVRVIIYKNYY